MTRSRVAGLLLVGALVASLVVNVLLWRDRQEVSALETSRADAEAAARSAVVEMTSYDFRTVDADFAWVEDAGTQEFQEFFTAASTNAVALIKELEATARGTVVDAATVLEDETHARVLLFVDQEISSQGEDGSKLDQPRVTFEMVRQDGDWLVDEVQVNNLVAE
ncbi:hypothetical protein [Nocardioides sp.]|uniref:hypothetical protein n=1 Tax=Nocardioides sp. TaxID=35761 RepID=UPI00286B0FD9|nr:hypothetical protein [Nocardioides sp.]